MQSSISGRELSTRRGLEFAEQNERFFKSLEHLGCEVVMQQLDTIDLQSKKAVGMIIKIMESLKVDYQEMEINKAIATQIFTKLEKSLGFLVSNSGQSRDKYFVEQVKNSLSGYKGLLLTDINPLEDFESLKNLFDRLLQESPDGLKLEKNKEDLSVIDQSIENTRLAIEQQSQLLNLKVDIQNHPPSTKRSTSDCEKFDESLEQMEIRVNLAEGSLINVAERIDYYKEELHNLSLIRPASDDILTKILHALEQFKALSQLQEDNKLAVPKMRQQLEKIKALKTTHLPKNREMNALQNEINSIQKALRKLTDGLKCLEKQRRKILKEMEQDNW